MSAEEKRKYRISQVLQENEKIIQSLIRERVRSVHSERRPTEMLWLVVHPLDINKDFERVVALFIFYS